MSRRQLTNQERFNLQRYDFARSLLTSNPDEAERIFIGLLEKPELALWKRTQCNCNLAYIASSAVDVEGYIRDARTSLQMFEETFADRRTPQMEDRISQMQSTLNELEAGLPNRGGQGDGSSKGDAEGTPIGKVDKPPGETVPAETVGEQTKLGQVGRTGEYDRDATPPVFPALATRASTATPNVTPRQPWYGLVEGGSSQSTQRSSPAGPAPGLGSVTSSPIAFRFPAAESPPRSPKRYASDDEGDLNQTPTKKPFRKD